MDAGAAVLLGAGAVVLAAFVVWSVFRERRLGQERAARVAERGWTLRSGSGSVVFTVEGSHEGVHFRLEHIRVRRSRETSGSSSHTVVHVDGAGGSAVVLVGPKLPAAIGPIDLGGMIVQALLRLLLGDRARQLADVRRVDGFEEHFAGHFDVLASDARAAHQLLDDGVRRALTAAAEGGALKGPPIVLRFRDGLQVRARNGERSFDAIAALVDVSAAVAKSSGNAAWGTTWG